MLEYIFKALFITSFIGAMATLFLTVIKPITRKYFSSSWHYYMWLLVLIVMVLPIKITLPEEMQSAPASEMVSQTVNEHNINIIDEPIQMVEQDLQLNLERERDIHNDLVTLKAFAFDKVNIIAYIWFVGMLLFFACKIMGYMIFLIKLHKYSKVVNCPELLNFTDKKIITRTSDKISSPLMIGLFKPTLLLPEFQMNEEQLNNILAHEMTHFKRKDIFYKWFISIIKCIHWFNPAIYYISKQADIECEISCDLAVVKEMSKEQETNYINTIITLLAAGNRRKAALTTGMTSDKKTLKRRFLMIKNRVKFSKKTIIISVVLALVLLCGTVLASGLLNGKFLNGYENELLAVNTDAREGDNFNFLVLGVDENNRADAIMLLIAQNGSLRGLSIPRNTIFEDKKISDILAMENGDQAVIDTIKKTLSVPIHYYAKMNLSAVEQIVDSFGGIYFEIPMDMIYEDPYQDLYINLKKGARTLNGKEVRQLLQFRRGYAEGDLSRIELHQQFINEFIHQKLTKENITKAPQIFEIISKNIKTNYPISNLECDLKMICAIGRDNISFETIPGKTAVVDQVLVYEALTENKPQDDAGFSLIWPTESKTIGNSFGKRVHPITGEEKMHNGVNISAPENAPVISATYGEVIDAGFDNKFGNYIVIQNDSGVRTYYGHLASINVAKGDQVKQKDVIGKVGKTGTAAGANLYFEIQINGQYRDPMEFWPENQNKTVEQIGSVKIKSNSIADEPYAGFEHLILQNINTNKIRQELNRQGIVETKKSSVDLTQNFIVKDYSSKQTKVESDDNGNISLYFSINSDNLFDVNFYDAETGEDVGSYGVLANNENAYTFIGFEKDKVYHVEVQSKTQDDWAIEGNYIIY